MTALIITLVLTLAKILIEHFNLIDRNKKQRMSTMAKMDHIQKLNEEQDRLLLTPEQLTRRINYLKSLEKVPIVPRRDNVVRCNVREGEAKYERNNKVTKQQDEPKEHKFSYSGWIENCRQVDKVLNRLSVM